MNKKKKGFLCLALCLILTVSFGMQGLRVNATNMSSITSDSIRDKQDQIKQAEKEREQMKSNLSLINVNTPEELRIMEKAFAEE